MNLESIRVKLGDHPKTDVDVYCNYLNQLYIEIDKQKNTPKNWWLHNESKVSEAMLVEIFNKVAKDKLYIDGDIITLSFKGKLIPDYSYQAYRKKLLMIHPESLIDPGLVYIKDKHHFEKISGKIYYTHEFHNPFSQTDANLEGSYCIVKNSKGEFIEFLSKDEALKMENAAKTDKVWKLWKSRMYLKSVIKRICKTFFYDHFKNIEGLDNDNYDLENIELSDEEKESLQAKAKLESLKKEFSIQFRNYKGKDREEVQKVWTDAYNDGKLTVEFILPLYNKIQYSNILDGANIPEDNELRIAFESMSEVSEEAVSNLVEHLKTL